MPGVRERSRVTVLGGGGGGGAILLGHFRMTEISDAVQQDRSAAYSDYAVPSRSHMIFFDAHGGIYSANTFPSPIIHINPLLFKTKTTSIERNNFSAKC